jgi:hypothetical protein
LQLRREKPSPFKESTMKRLLWILALCTVLGWLPSRSAADYTDITGTKLKVVLHYPDCGPDGPGASRDHDTPDNLNSPYAKILSAQPLSQMFDQIWTANQARVTKAVQMQISSVMKDATNITPTLPAKGKLLAGLGDVAGQMADTLPLDFRARQLTLLYRVSGATASWKTSGGASWTVTFDIELELAIAIPVDPTFPIGQMVPQATRWIGPPQFPQDPQVPQGMLAEIWARNLTLDGNTMASLEKDGKHIADFINGQPSNDAIPDQMVPIRIKDLFAGNAIDFTQLFTGFKAAVHAGFRYLTPDLKDKTVILRLSHPTDRAPVVKNIVVNQVAGLIPPVLSTSASQVKAGGSLTVKGQNFPGGQAHQLLIEWTDTTTGSVTQSVLEWGPKNGPTKTVPISRKPWDGKNTFLATKLSPDTVYTFRVIDHDSVTCTKPGVLNVKTEHSQQLTLFLDYGVSKAVGTAQIGVDGSFSATITVPAQVPAGTHRLWTKTQTGKVVETTITVVGAKQNLQPLVMVIDPTTGAALKNPAVVETRKYTVRGEGFSPGRVDLYVDSAKGKKLASVTADANGTFTATFVWPSGVRGNHQVMALEVIKGQKIQASAGVNGQGMAQ